MASFTVRIELNDAGPADHATVEEAMKVEGFVRTIKSDEGITYLLPTYEYSRRGEFTRDDVIEAAKRAASKRSANFSVLVTESNGRKWFGLPKIEEAEGPLSGPSDTAK